MADKQMNKQLNKELKRRASAALGLISAALLGWLSLGAGGCNTTSPSEATCQKACECLGSKCPNGYVTECVAATQEKRDEAATAGCDSQFDALLLCLGGDSVPCEATTNPCQTEQDAFDACGATDPSVCAPAIDRIGSALDNCSVDSSGVRATTCTDASAHLLKCQEPCYDAASCDAITGKDAAGGKTFNDCLAACNG